METILATRSLPPVPRPTDDQQVQQDAAQEFVARLRAAAPLFAAAAGAQSAVVIEAVPPPGTAAAGAAWCFGTPTAARSTSRSSDPPAGPAQPSVLVSTGRGRGCSPPGDPATPPGSCRTRTRRTASRWTCPLGSPRTEPW